MTKDLGDVAEGKVVDFHNAVDSKAIRRLNAQMREKADTFIKETDERRRKAAKRIYHHRLYGEWPEEKKY